MRKILNESKENKKVIGIRIYRDDEKLWCGYIKDFNESLVLIQHFTEFGQTDGIVIEKIENIESIDSGDKYSSAFQYLIGKQNDIEQESNQFDLPNSKNWQYDFLKRFNKVDQIISLEFNGDFTIYGRIKDLDSEYIKLEPVGNLGDLDGLSIYRISDITAIRVDNAESIKRKKLLEWNLKRNSSE